MNNTNTLTQQAANFFSVIGRAHLIQNLNSLKGAAEYANNMLNGGGLQSWEAKEYSAVVYNNMTAYNLEVARMNAVAIQLS